MQNMKKQHYCNKIYFVPTQKLIQNLYSTFLLNYVSTGEISRREVLSQNILVMSSNFNVNSVLRENKPPSSIILSVINTEILTMIFYYYLINELHSV